MSWFKDLVLFTLLLSVLFFTALGQRPLSSPDEARYSEIPREMLVSGDFVTPHLNGIKYFEKPPLLYWIQTFSFKTFGLNEWGARIPTALFALLSCLITYSVARFLYTRRTGIYAGIILATSLLYFAMAHVLTLDMTLSFMFTACFSCLLATLNLPIHSSTRKLFSYGFYIFSAGAVLTKGLVGLLFPGAILFFWLLLLNRWSVLKHLSIISGLILFFALIVPWHYVVQIKNPEFFNFYVLDQQFLRFFTMSAGRYQPAWFFVVILLIGFFPWTILLVQAIYHALRTVLKNKITHHNELFLLLWASIIFIFFSISKSKLIPYILPVFPPLSILTAHYFSVVKRSKSAAFALMMITVLLVAAIYFAANKYMLPGTMYKYLIIFSLILVIGAIANYILLRRNLTQAFWTLTAWAVIFNSTLLMVSLYIETTSVKPLILQIKTRLQPHDLVVSYNHYYQDMPFYLNRLITIVDWENELSFGMAHQNVTSLAMKSDAFWRIWQGPQTIYVIMDERNYKKLSKMHPLYLIDKMGNDVLITNYPLNIKGN